MKKNSKKDSEKEAEKDLHTVPYLSGGRNGAKELGGIAVYCRVSTGEQAEGVSLEAQKAACKGYCEGQSWEVRDCYQDVESGRKNERVEFSLLRKRLKSYDAVVFWRLDRISRSTIDICRFIEECDRSGTLFISVTEGFDTGTIMGRAMAQMAGIFAEMESSVIGQRVRVSKARMREDGKIPHMAKYGYARTPEGIACVLEPEAKVVKRIYELSGKGLNFHQIVPEIEEAKRGKKWSFRKVRELVRDPDYKGEGLYPRIVSDQDWGRAQRGGLNGRRGWKRRVLQGLLRCGICGKAIHVKDSDSYNCSGARSKECKGNPVAINILERRFSEYIQNGYRPLIAPLDPYTVQERLRDAERKHELAQRGYMEELIGIDALRASKRVLEKLGQELALSQSEPHRAAQGEAGLSRRKILKGLEIGGEKGNELLRRVIRRIEVGESIRVVLNP